MCRSYDPAMSALTRMLPPRLKDGLKVLLGRADAVPRSSDPAEIFACSVCGADRVTLQPLPWSRLRKLDEHQHAYSVFQYETFNYEYYSCVRCGAKDRDRLYAMYFRRALQGRSEPLAVLDIAPSAPLTAFLKASPQIRLRTADLKLTYVDDQVDITDMRMYTDEQFDAFICSHVLEHVPDDVAAMKELHRVTKRGGWGIAMVPIHLGLPATQEDPSITDEGGRWKYFGQNDHVRIYSKTTFIERLQSAGFLVQQLGRSYFGDDAFARHGIHPRSVLYVVTK
jgi:SAM-dependent methyltransferase